MSRLAKKPIQIPEKTEVTLRDNEVAVKGPKGEIARSFPNIINIAINGKEIVVTITTEDRDKLPLLGTAVAHIKNMIAGVNTPYQKKLIIEGIGFKADAQGGKLNMALGFSHPVVLAIPEGLTVATEKGAITVTGIDKEAVGQFAATIREHKKPEPYKGKGIRYENEVIRRKQGKKTA